MKLITFTLGLLISFPALSMPKPGLSSLPSRNISRSGNKGASPRKNDAEILSSHIAQIVRLRAKKSESAKKLLEEAKLIQAFKGHFDTAEQAWEELGFDSIETFKSALGNAYKARNRFVEMNLGLAMDLAKRYYAASNKQGVDLMDFVQEATIGIIQAVEKFDETLGKFSTYSRYHIRNTTSRFSKNASRNIRLPVHIYDWARKHRQYKEDFFIQNARYPEATEICEYFEMSKKAYFERLEQLKCSSSLNIKTGHEKENCELIDLVPSNLIGPEDLNFLDQLRKDLYTVFGLLNDQQRDVIELRFGLADGQPKSLEKVGEILGISRERARQVEHKALRTLRRPSSAQKLKDYIMRTELFENEL